MHVWKLPMKLGRQFGLSENAILSKLYFAKRNKGFIFLYLIFLIIVNFNVSHYITVEVAKSGPILISLLAVPFHIAISMGLAGYKSLALYDTVLSSIFRRYIPLNKYLETKHK